MFNFYSYKHQTILVPATTVKW